jgi:hypothetical protein
MAEPCLVVSCHVERPLDDAAWGAFSRLQARKPGGAEIAALVRPPDPETGESESLWTARARIAAARGPFGLHTHWGGAAQARPDGVGDPAALVRSQLDWLDERGFQPRLFAGGGWYVDEAVAAVLAERGVADCTATAFRPEYLEPGAPRLELAEPVALRVGGNTLTELPTTHSLGMAAGAALRRLPAYVHVYFHDTDLLDAGRSRALSWALSVLGRRRRSARLDRLEAAGEVEFSSAASGP